MWVDKRHFYSINYIVETVGKGPSSVALVFKVDLLGVKGPPCHQAYPVWITIEFHNSFGVIICWYNACMCIKQVVCSSFNYSFVALINCWNN